MTTMVDRVAAALYEHQRKTYPDSATAKKQFYDDGIYHHAARVAIEAMRKPTTEMVESPSVKRHMDSYSSNLEWWDQMISAALVEKLMGGEDE